VSLSRSVVETCRKIDLLMFYRTRYFSAVALLPINLENEELQILVVIN
jgi:hypothetical protein